MLTVVPDDCPGQPGGMDRCLSLVDEIVRGPHLVALVHAGAVFGGGVLLGHPEQAAA
jgi:hypothetical protein